MGIVTMLNSPIETREEHTTHQFTVAPQKFAGIHTILLVIPKLLPKKIQMRVPNSAKKDYCRFRIPIMRVEFLPTGIISPLDVTPLIEFFHVDSPEKQPVTSFPILSLVSGTQLLITGENGKGPEISIRQKGSWIMRLTVTLKNQSISLSSEPMRIFGSNYQKELQEHCIFMKGCTLCNKSHSPEPTIVLPPIQSLSSGIQNNQTAPSSPSTRNQLAPLSSLQPLLGKRPSNEFPLPSNFSRDRIWEGERETPQQKRISEVKNIISDLNSHLNFYHALLHDLESS